MFCMNNKYSKQKSRLCITFEINLSANLYFLQQEVYNVFKTNSFVKKCLLSTTIYGYSNPVASE